MPKSIAVAGKGGTGKSTIASLIVLSLKRRGETPILVVDADPDANMSMLLNVDVEQTIGDMREEALKEIKNFPAGMSKAAYVEAGLHELIVEAEGFDLLTMGRGEGSGCYCYLNNLIRKFVDDLSPSYRWLVMDNEAGLEHISRRTTRDIDSLLIVVNDNPLAVGSARRIGETMKSVEGRIKKTYVVLNMAGDATQFDVGHEIENLGMELLCRVPFDENLRSAVQRGDMSGLNGSTPAGQAIETIIEKIGG